MIPKQFPSTPFLAKLASSLLLVMLAACSTTPVDDGTGQTARPSGSIIQGDEQTLQTLLAQATAAPSPQKEEILYQAAMLMRDLGREEDALLVLEPIIPDALPLALSANILLLKAQLYVSDNRPRDAISTLTDPVLDRLPQLPKQSRLSIHLFRANLYNDLKRPLESARELIMANHLLPLPAVPANHEQIWNALTALEPANLAQLAQQDRRFEYQGWYELAVVGKAYQYNLDRQVIELGRWRDTWARHPAAAMLPRALQLVETMAEERPRNIALLLPLDTPAGIVIRNGFLSAYYDIMQIGGQVPQIRFYNTSGLTDIIALYNQAVSDGAEMVIGPLQKHQVAQLYDLPTLPVQTLALNNVESSSPLPRNLYQFALSPENEAIQIADRAWRDGHRYAAILSPAETRDDFYQRKRNSFIDHWLALGGRIVTQATFSNDYTGTVEALLDLDDSERRMESVSELINEDLAFTQRRRQDIDFIFLIAEPGPARQINPTLAYLYAGDIPVYASQDVYSGIPRPLVDNDLNGILFGDSPWLLGFDDELKVRTSNLFPQNNALTLRLQAFGIDAFRLYPRLQQLESVPDSQIYGATGLLRLGDSRNIIRELSWARVTEGLANIETSAP